MKTIIRVFNIVIMALCVAAGLFLFMPPALSFNSKVTISVSDFSKFVPETEYSKDIDIPTLLGTENIYVGIKFQLDAQGIGEMKDGDREKINDSIIADNVDEIVSILHEPVDLITDFAIRANVKKLIAEQVTNYVNQAFEDYKAAHPGSEKAFNSTTEEILEEVGIDDEYYTNFTYELYDAANAEGATVDSTNEVLFDQINEALVRAKTSGVVDTSGFTDEQKASVKASLQSVFASLDLIEDDGTLKPISQISYVYLSAYLKKELTGKAAPETLERQVGETIPDYADRLLDLYVRINMPDLFYQIVGYVSLGLYIGLFVFVGVWGLLLLITLIKTFTKKPWTIFGPWFWFVGFIQLVIGLGTTAIVKYALTQVDIASFGLPIKEVLASLKTYALIPSFMYLGAIVIAIVYGFFKRGLKYSLNQQELKEAKAEQDQQAQQAQQEEDDDEEEDDEE